MTALLRNSVPEAGRHKMQRPLYGPATNPSGPHSGPYHYNFGAKPSHDRKISHTIVYSIDACTRTPMKPVRVGRYLIKDPGVCHGKLTFKGTRVPVETVLNRLGRGRSVDEILQAWPELR